MQSSNHYRSGNSNGLLFIYGHPFFDGNSMLGTKGTIIKPYKHDCDNCVWVGWIPCRDAKNGWGNTYFCPPATRIVGDIKGLGSGSVMIRYGDKPEEYLSMPVGVCTKGSLEVRT